MLSSTRHIPKRLQHSRRKGASLPEGAVYVGRPSRWGNPFARRQWNHAKAVNLFDRWLTGDLAGLSLERLGLSGAEIEALDRRRIWVLTHLHELAGKNLVCWCPRSSPWCHANTLLRLAPLYAEYERLAA